MPGPSPPQARVRTWIAENELTAVGLVETWHDGADSPALVACTPPGYVFAERAQPRTDQQCSMSTNHGGVCLLYRDRFHARVISNNQQYQSFEHVAVFLHGNGLKSLFCVIYRPGSSPANNTFFDEFANFLEHITRYSSVVIIGDINIHLDRRDDQATVSFCSTLSTYNLIQIVQLPTHSAGHLLDVVIVRPDLLVSSINVPPPILADHSMIDVELEMRCFQHFSSTYSLRRSWRSFDYSAFENDLISSTLINDTPLDTNELFSEYYDTLRSLLDKHAPFRRVCHFRPTFTGVV